MQLPGDSRAQLVWEDHGRHPGAGLGITKAGRLRADATAMPDHLHPLDQDHDPLQIDLHRRERHQAARTDDPLQPVTTKVTVAVLSVFMARAPEQSRD
jgi:hypothetical protein